MFKASERTQLNIISTLMECAKVIVLRENSSKKSHLDSSSAPCATPLAKAARHLQLKPAANHAKMGIGLQIRGSVCSSARRTKFGSSQADARFASPDATVVRKKPTLASSTSTIS